VSELHCFENLERKRCRSPRNVSGDDDRGPELTDGARKSEDNSSNDATRSQWKRNGKKDASVARAQRSRDLFQPLIDGLKSDTGRTYQERKRHDGSRSNDRAPGENDVNPQMLVQKMTHCAAATEKF
jgi:hypothetical protein